MLPLRAMRHLFVKSASSRLLRQLPAVQCTAALQYRQQAEIRRRNFSTDEKGTTVTDLPMRAYTFVTENRAALFYGGIGSVTFYGITRFMYDITYQFLALTPATSLYYGFMGGSISTTIFGSCVLAAYGTLSMHPNNSYKLASNIASNDAELKKYLGANAGRRLSVDQLKTYTALSGGVNFSTMALQSPQMYIMFKIYDKKKCDTYALVYAHCSKHRFREKVEFLGADVFEGAQKKARHVIRGHENDFDKFDDMLN